MPKISLLIIFRMFWRYGPTWSGICSTRTTMPRSCSFDSSTIQIETVIGQISCPRMDSLRIGHNCQECRSANSRKNSKRRQNEGESKSSWPPWDWDFDLVKIFDLHVGHVDLTYERSRGWPLIRKSTLVFSTGKLETISKLPELTISNLCSTHLSCLLHMTLCWSSIFPNFYNFRGN